jgi:hypothetical protein
MAMEFFLRSSLLRMLRFDVPPTPVFRNQETAMTMFHDALNGGVRVTATISTLLVFVWLTALQAQTARVNTVKRIQTVNGIVEIEVHSTREFPVRDQVVVLRIGDKEFLQSKSPEDGSLTTLIFLLTPAQFEALPDGATMTVKYGREKDGGGPQAEAALDARGLKWNFGQLNKALHQR